MARVVQRRGNPPILLIVFVILFVAATIVAVVGFVQRDDWETQYNDQKAQIRELNDEAKDLKQKNVELIFLITGERGGDTTKIAVQKTDQVYASGAYIAARSVAGISGNVREGLVKDVAFLAAKVKTSQDNIDKLQGTIAQLNAQLVAAEKRADEQIAKDKKEIQKYIDRMDKIQTALNTKQDESEKSIQNFADELSSLRSKSRTDSTEYESRLEKHILDLQQRKKEIAKLRTEIALLNEKLSMGSGGASDDADGKVYKVLEDEGVCYINLGSDDNIAEGITFAVFAPDAPEGSKPKAKLQAVNVSPKFAECKITEVGEDQTISVNDEVVNLAYEPGRKYQFVVKGDFDLHGTGKSTKAAADEIKQAIKLHGGNVAEDISVQTDYVVLGVEPLKPLKPADDAPSSVQRSYEKQLKLYNDYFNTKKQATTLRIPVLNTNRFLELTGYMPEKNPEE